LIPWTPTEGCLTELVSSSPEETEALGEDIARRLKPGAVVALRGGLGSGKTSLAKGIARGLGVGETVTSPTYTIIAEYAGTIPLRHIDAYRLSGDEDFERTGAAELLGGDGVSLIEWSERIPHSLPDGVITIAIEITGPTERHIRVSGLDMGKARGILPGGESACR
jgi:tRNA threonylcarbamoyladenosine biosynthesis protein TsaE